MSRSIRMPRALPGSDPVVAINALAAAIEQQLTASPTGRAYTVTNGTDARAINVSSAAVVDVARTVGTLIGDLQKGGLIG